MRELDWMDVAAAFEKLSAEDQAMLESLAMQLVEGLRMRYEKPVFSRSAAMELLAKLGVWMIGGGTI